ncbi:MAG: universal stress protein [Verrucomicrobiales bacterium]
MSEFTSIIVGIDYSENSANALREASRIANWNDAKLLCLHIFDEEIFGEFRDHDEFDESAVRAAALGHLQEFVAKTIGAGHEIECQISVGHPFEEILSAVEARGADLLVMGSQGQEMNASGRTGVLSSRCARKAPVDVLLVRERQSEPFRNIVACVDFSENSIRAAHHAASIALQDKAALELLHVYRPPVYIAPETGIFGPTCLPIDTREIKLALAQKLEQLAEEVSASCGGCEIRTHIEECAVVSGGIFRRLAEVGADIAVLGTRGRTGLRGFFTGTTAEQIIHRSPCSALAVKPEGFHYKLG